jgi:hypothetical protein
VRAIMSRVAESLLQLRNQIDAMAPERDTSSDATIGDPSFSARKSDHNPNSDGVVTAIDITNDPAHGIDAGELAERLRLSQDPRIKYVISNGRIFSSQNQPWQWRPYVGANAHASHLHLSVVGDKALYDDTRPWPIEGMAKPITPPPPTPEPASKRYTDIIATVLGGAGEDKSSAYDRHPIDEAGLGAALPFRFKGARPDVKVTNPANGQSVVCKLVGVGPWNSTDPYWASGDRPQAESGKNKRGRKTDRAGIALTPALARLIGLDGIGTVEWEFVEPPERIERPERAVEKRHDDTQLPPPADTARPTAPSEIDGRPEPAVAERTAINEPLSVDEMADLNLVFRETPAARSGVVNGRPRDDSRLRAGVPQAAPPPPPGGVVILRSPPAGLPPTRPHDVAVLLDRLLARLSQTQGTTATPPSAPPQSDQLRKMLEILAATATPGPDGKAPPLGQVNGALGETLGNLLSGKKTAIGVVGALVTSILSHVPAGSGLGQALELLTPSVGLTPFAMPVFLAMSAWGVLGKFEKWSQQTAVAEGPPLSATSDTLQRNMDLIKLLLPLLANPPAAPPASIAGGAGGRGPAEQQSFGPIQYVPPRGDVSAGQQSSEPIEDLVDCSVFGPPAAPPGETILIQVFLHLPEQAERAERQARLMDSSAVLKGLQSLQTPIKRNASVDISLGVDTLVVEEPVQSVVWRGEPAFCQFRVTIPEGTQGRNFFPNVRVSVNGRLVGRIMFRLSSDRFAASPRSTALGDHARRYEFAFVSYATKDREEVLKRVQMLQVMKTEYFQDVLSLDPGARWKEELYKNIDHCDLFLLFWSSAAKKSRWVIREAEYALERQGRHPYREPDIVPVILEQKVRPPRSLADLQFNDRIGYLISRKR